MLERCPKCGSDRLRDEVADFTVAQDGKSEVIKDRRMVCAACGTVSYQGDQIAEHEYAVAAAIRRMDGLLSAEDLRRIRSRYRLKQTDMEQILSTGPKTWTRWERGKIPQSKPADRLIRALADDPSLTHRLMLQAGVSNPEAELTFHQMEDEARRLAKARLRAELGDVIAGANADKIFERMFDTVTQARRDAAGYAGS